MKTNSDSKASDLKTDKSAALHSAKSIKVENEPEKVVKNQQEQPKNSAEDKYRYFTMSPLISGESKKVTWLGVDEDPEIEDPPEKITEVTTETPSDSEEGDIWGTWGRSKNKWRLRRQEKLLKREYKDKVAFIEDEHEIVMKQETCQKIILGFVIGAILFLIILNMYGIIDQAIPVASGKSTRLDKRSLSSHINDSLTDQPLPNLTLDCMKSYGECYYHKNHVPTNCQKSYCTNVIVEISENLDKPGTFEFSHVSQNSTKLLAISVPNRTYCGPGKWCQNGKCVSTNDEMILNHTLVKRRGGVGHNCKELTCITGKKETLNKLSELAECSEKLCDIRRDNHSQLLRLNFLSCNAPIPVGMDPNCFTNESGLRPWFPVTLCPKCQSSTNFTDSSCDTTNEGFYCNITGTDMTSYNETDEHGTVCMNSQCVPLYYGAEYIFPFTVAECHTLS